MADLNEIYDAIRKADAQGDTASVKALATYLQSQKPAARDPSEYDPSSAAYQAKYGPVAGNSKLQNAAIGAGQSLTDLAYGVGQDIGLVSRQDVANKRQTDAPLASAPGAGVGRFVGTTAALLPAAFIPGANTLAGAAAIGAGSGLLQPSTSTSETIKDTGYGAAGGLAGILSGRVLGAAYQGGKALLQPLFAGGQQQIASRALQSFAGSPEAAQTAASALQNAPSVLPGVQPTSAELANNAGISQLERSLRNNPEYLNALTARNQANRAAMTGALQNIAGSDADMALAERMRKTLTSPLYDEAKNASVQADDSLKALLSRPSLKNAWSRAQTLAEEQQDKLVVGKDIPAHIATSPILDSSGSAFATEVPAQVQTYSGKALQYLKMSLNDMLSTGKQQGMGSHEEGALRSTLGALNEWTMKNVPQLRAADRSYAELSQPINQMEIGTALSNKLQPALSDFGNNTRLSAAAYANAVRNGDVLAAKATGFPAATLENSLRPDQLRTVIQVGQQLARRANADELGRAVGSNTGQNLVSQNVLRSFLGPLGLPQSVGERAAQSAFGESIMRPVQWLGKAGEPRIMNTLAEAALDPTKAATLLMQNQNPAISQAIWERQGLAGLTGASVAAYLTQ